MSQEITNSEILQAIIELSHQVNDLSLQQKETSNQVNDLSLQLTDTDKRLNAKIDIVDAKIDILSNRLLETQAEVNVLKGVK